MPGSQPARILVADDEPTILELIRTVLSLWSYEVEVCPDGDTALSRALEGGFALLLIDHLMPRMTGFEALQKIRAAKQMLPVILMSGHLPDEIARKARKLGGVELLPKPFTLAALREALDRAQRPGAAR
jgi:CheY-like chemotaxis protein